LLIFEPYLNSKHARLYGEFLRSELPFYRVIYTLKRYGKETVINTPRYTVRSGCQDGACRAASYWGLLSRQCSEWMLRPSSIHRPVTSSRHQRADLSKRINIRAAVSRGLYPNAWRFYGG
jgi:hypothetical protein